MTTDTTRRTEAALRPAAASGDGALALLEACRENVALRGELAEARAVYEAKWTALPGDTLADMMRALVSEVRSQQAAARARGRALDCAETRAERLLGYARHRYDCARWEGTTRVDGKPCTCGLAALTGQEESHG